MTLPLERDDPAAIAARDDALDVLLRFGAALLRAGDTAYRVRELMGVLARSMDLDALSVNLTLNSITASARRAGQQATMMREIGPPGVNSTRIAALERLARGARAGAAPREIAAELATIEAMPARYAPGLVAALVGAGCSGFAFLSGGDPLEMIGAGVGGGVGQRLRARLLREGFNHYGVTALCAVVASGIYAVIVVAASHFDFGDGGHAAGFISSILFLVPGFPLVAALLDFLQYQMAAAVTRFAYSIIIFLAAAFGLSLVVAIIGFHLEAQPPFEISYLLKLLLRAAASFVGGYAFASLFNNAPRAALAVGLVALAANELRLALHDSGMMLAPATFLGALAVVLMASLVRRRLGVPLITLTVPGIIVMIPGVYAFEMIVLFNQGKMLEALQAASVCGFVMGAMATGLATGRFLTQRWRGLER